MFKEFGGPRLLSDNAKYRKHLREVRDAKKKIDNNPIDLDIDKIFKPATLQSDAAAMSKIEHDNRKLIQAINVIYRTKGKVNCDVLTYSFRSNYNERKMVNNSLENSNMKLYKRLLEIKPNYKTRDTEKDYVKMRRSFLKSCGKDPNQKPLKVAEDWSIISDGMTQKQDPAKRVKCFFDIEGRHERKGEHINMGRIHIEVYRDLAPIAGENFIRLCRGDNKISYKGTIFHKVFPGKLCIGGDVEKRKGLGGVSAFGFSIPSEDPVLEFNGPGVFGTFTPEPGKNTSQFLITFKEMKPLKKKYVAFGKIVYGRALEMVEEFGTKSGFPLMDITIIKCGVVSPDSEKAPRHGSPEIPRELVELTEKLKNEEDRDRRQRLDFEEKQIFYKKYGFLTPLDPVTPYPPFPWKMPKMQDDIEKNN